MKQNLLRHSCCMLTLIFTGPVLAQSESNPFRPWYLTDKESGRWYVDAFAGFESEPTYAGSDKNESEAGVDLRGFYKFANGHRFFVNLGEIGGIFEINPDLQFSAILEYEEGRDDEEDDTLTGFDEVDDTVEGQFAISKRWGNTSAAFVFQPDILDRGKGLVYFIGLQHDRVVNDKLRVSPSVDISFADSEHMRTEFGVTDAESDRTGLAAYEPGSGLKSATLGLDIEYSFSEKWSLLGGIEVEHYFSEASDSPLIDQEGSDTTSEIFLGVRYRFF